MTMTHREQLRENYEDALFAMWMDDFAQSRGEAFLAENERLQDDPGAAVSPDLRRKNLRLIRRLCQRAGRSQTARGMGRSALRFVLVAAVLLALFGAAYALSPSFRAGTLNLLMQLDERAASFQLTEESADDPVNVPTVEVNWLPEGYIGDAPIIDRIQTTINCSNAFGDSVQISVFWDDGTLYNLDIEDAEIFENLDINGKHAILTIKYGLTRIGWADNSLGAYIYVDSAALTREELIQVAEGILITP